MSGAGPSETRLSRFLLGTLPEAEHAEIEERLFTDEELQLVLDGATDELVHAYLDGALSPEDRSAFDRHFLAAARHRERLAFLRDLMEATRRAAARDEAQRAATLPPRRTTFWLLTAAAALLAAVAVVTLRTTTNEPRQTVTHTPPTVESPVAPSAPATATPTSADSPSPRALPVEPVRAIRLAAGRSGPTAEIELTASTRTVRLEVPVDPGAPTYDAVVRDGAGRETWRAEGLTPSEADGPLVLSLPADNLPSGEYTLTIEGEALRGQPTGPLLERRLRVVRR